MIMQKMTTLRLTCQLVCVADGLMAVCFVEAEILVIACTSGALYSVHLAIKSALVISYLIIPIMSIKI